MEEETYTFGEYFNGVQQRLQSLSEDEMSILGKLKNSPQGQILGKVLGEDLGLLNSNINSVKKRGLAARK